MGLPTGSDFNAFDFLLFFNLSFLSLIINANILTKVLNDGWLVGWLGYTALQHNIGYIAPVSVV